MKRALVIVFFVFTGFPGAVAQDIISLKSGQEVKSRIIHLNPDDVIYIPENGTDTLSILRTEVSKLQYHNGTLVYLEEKRNITVDDGSVNDSMFLLGSRDAKLYYKGYKAAATGTLISSIYFPWGLIPAIACSSTPPSKNNLGYRDLKLIENSSYYNGYSNQAYKIKKKKVWQSFAIGSGITVGLSVLITIAALSVY